MEVFLKICYLPKQPPPIELMAADQAAKIKKILLPAFLLYQVGDIN